MKTFKYEIKPKYIQDLLKGRNADFDASRNVKLIRHASAHTVKGMPFVGTISQLYKNRDLFLRYQKHQRRANFANVDYIVSFISEKGTDSLFVGVFRNLGETSEPCSKPDECYFDFEEVPGFEDLKERVIIEWNNPRTWHQWYSNKMKIVAVNNPSSGEQSDQNKRFQQFNLHGSYSFIFDEIIRTEKTRDNVKKIIVILVRLAKQGITSITYKNLLVELGYPSGFSGIGRQLKYVDLVFKQLEELSGENIPILNAFVKSESSDLPSEGFEYVYPSYNNMSPNEKRIFVAGINHQAISFDKWDWVLNSLGLSPSDVDIRHSEAIIRSGSYFGSGGEGEEHRALKEYIYNHPETLGIRDVKVRTMEHILLSGDRLDVYFERYDGSKIAVEVKPSSSPDADVLRGLFQCVKYKCVLDAEDKLHGHKSNNATILVLGGSLSSENREVKDAFCLTVKENFNH